MYVYESHASLVVSEKRLITLVRDTNTARGKKQQPDQALMAALIFQQYDSFVSSLKPSSGWSSKKKKKKTLRVINAHATRLKDWYNHMTVCLQGLQTHCWNWIWSCAGTPSVHISQALSNYRLRSMAEIVTPAKTISSVVLLTIHEALCLESPQLGCISAPVYKEKMMMIAAQWW